MTESDRPMKRLLEQANSPLERALLLAGADVRLSDETRAAALEAVGLGVRRGTRVRALPFGRTALLIAAMVISAAAVAIPLAGRVVIGQSALPPVTPATSVERVGPSSVIGEVAPEPQKASSIESLPLEMAEESASRRSSASEVSAGSLRPASGRAARNLLAAELAALDAARVQLAAGDARGALVMLDAYHREFSRPRLSLEAEVLRIDALDRAGQVDAARRRAEAFVQNHPKGVLTGRVKRYLER